MHDDWESACIYCYHISSMHMTNEWKKWNTAFIHKLWLTSARISPNDTFTCTHWHTRSTRSSNRFNCPFFFFSRLLSLRFTPVNWQPTTEKKMRMYACVYSKPSTMSPPTQLHTTLQHTRHSLALTTSSSKLFHSIDRRNITHKHHNIWWISLHVILIRKLCRQFNSRPRRNGHG